MKGGNIYKVFFDNIFSNILNNIDETLNENDVKILYLSNPNNPSGRKVPKNEIEILIRKYSKTWFLIDEAYVEFYGDSLVPLAEKYTNLIIFRTFSKAFSLAGIRIGYIVSNSKNIKIINKVRNGKDVSPIGQHIAILALNYLDDFELHLKI